MRGANLKFESNRFVSVKERSGKGKTTSLNRIGGLNRPTSGIPANGTQLALADKPPGKPDSAMAWETLLCSSASQRKDT